MTAGGLCLAIETSCDETACAVVADGSTVVANLVSSQTAIHREFGGVVPELASRQHLRVLAGLVDEAMRKSRLRFSDLGCIAVTVGPGLIGALLVGVSYAKALGYAAKLPVVPVNHITGHIYANFLGGWQPEFPALCLVVSGGHTSLVLMSGDGRLTEIGRTRDDAAGEAFDKVARVLGLAYPGGPALERLAASGRGDAVALPRARLEPGSFDFSFSGLKTAVLYLVRGSPQNQSLSAGGAYLSPADIAASFQAAVVDMLVDRTVAAARHFGVRQVWLAGGVAANRHLRKQLGMALHQEGIGLHAPPPEFCTDNAAMIGVAGYMAWQRGVRAGWNFTAVADLAVGEEVS